MFKQHVIDSQKVTLTANGEVKKKCKILGVPVPTRGGIRGISQITIVKVYKKSP
jgi:hypothetical protein